MTKSAFYVFALLLTAPLASTSYAQEKAIGIFKVSFDEPPGPKDQEFAKPIMFRLRQSSAVPDDFHARLFRGSVATLKKRLPDSDGCVHFDTALLPVTVRGSIEMRSLDDPAWLRPAGDGFAAEQYTIVFESGNEPAVQVLRIHKTELDGYFQYAVSINLLPPENLKSKVKETVARAQGVLQNSNVTFQQVTKSVCWSVKPELAATRAPVDHAETAVKMAELSPCVDRAPAHRRAGFAFHFGDSRLRHEAASVLGNSGTKGPGPRANESATAVAAEPKVSSGATPESAPSGTF
jgi:hypothetical protein